MDKNYIDLQAKRNNRNKRLYLSDGSVDDIFSIYRKRNQLPCVIPSSNFYCTIIKGDEHSKIKGIPLSFEYRKEIHLLSMVFHSVEMDCSITEI